MGKERIQRASYDSRSHTNVLCQMHGSAWPKVLPYCLLNLAWIGLVAFLKEHTPINLTFNSLKAFAIMGILVRTDNFGERSKEGRKETNKRGMKGEHLPQRQDGNDKMQMSWCPCLYLFWINEKKRILVAPRCPSLAMY